MAFLDININDLPESKYSLIPEGWYSATISEVRLEPTKDGAGQKLVVKFAIIGPTQQGRSIYANLNIKNASAKAEEIGRSQLGDIMRAIGLTHVQDSDQLIGGNLQIKIAVKIDEQYGTKNEVKGYKASGDSMPADAIPTFAKPTAAESKPASAAPPWAKK